MRYADVHKMNISDGPGIGVSVYVQGCQKAVDGNPCKGCFNPETWSFDGGKKWTDDIRESVIGLLRPDYMSRLSILGGEPLCPCNYMTLLTLVHTARCELVGKKKFSVWLWTGRMFEDVVSEAKMDTTLYCLLHEIDYIVDGPFMESKKDLTLKWRGSSNQRIIDVKKTLDTIDLETYNGKCKVIEIKESE